MVDRTKWPAVAGYIRRAIPPVNRVILERVWRDLEIAETPPGSNRGVRVELYLARGGADEALIRSGKGYWCAAWVGAVWEDAGAAVPPRGARLSCDGWGAWAKRGGLWVSAREAHAKGAAGIPEGSAVLYGTPDDLSHIGIVTRWDQWYRRAAEGNTSAGGYSREGTFVAFKDIALPRVQGYVMARAA